MDVMDQGRARNSVLFVDTGLGVASVVTQAERQDSSQSTWQPGSSCFAYNTKAGIRVEQIKDSIIFVNMCCVLS